jgi:hypothetical protein
MIAQMNYPSKVFAAYGIMEWGLSEVKLTSPSSFTARTKGEVVKFVCTICSHTNFEVFIPPIECYTLQSEFLLMLIDNKAGDNFIVLSGNDMHKYSGKMVSFETLAPMIKRKARFEIHKQSNIYE